MNEIKCLNLLGLALRANKLKLGEGFVLRAIKNRNAKLVFVASNASANTQKKLTDKCQSYQIAINTQFSKMQLSGAVGKAITNIAVCDSGFAVKMQTLLNQ